jgi:hypothetical protein
LKANQNRGKWLDSASNNLCASTIVHKTWLDYCGNFAGHVLNPIIE